MGIWFYVGDRKSSDIESDTLIGLGSGNSFTNNLNLNSADVWLDIGGDFTNNGSITGSNSVDIIANHANIGTKCLFQDPIYRPKQIGSKRNRHEKLS